jgi:hypothetical protein
MRSNLSPAAPIRHGPRHKTRGIRPQAALVLAMVPILAAGTATLALTDQPETSRPVSDHSSPPGSSLWTDRLPEPSPRPGPSPVPDSDEKH